MDEFDPIQSFVILFGRRLSNAFYICFRPKMAGFRNLRRQLDDLGYYQPLVLDAVPLVEALVQDLLTTTHNLKVRGGRFVFKNDL